MEAIAFRGGTIVLEDRLLPRGEVAIQNGWIDTVNKAPAKTPASAKIIDLHGGYLAPGFIDLHVHGGAGADLLPFCLATGDRPRYCRVTAAIAVLPAVGSPAPPA
jgi:imidazolonepropionase-like amidohydrolase